MADGSPVVLQVSINGVGFTNGGHFPATPEEIAAVSLECIENGAAIIHNHVDRVKCGVDEAVERYLAGWRLLFEKRPDALIFPTTHFGAPDGQPSYDHIEPLAASGMLKLSFCDVGSVGIIGEVREGVPFGPAVYANSLDDTATRLEQHGRLGIGTVVNIYDMSGLRNFVLWHRAGKAPKGCSINLYCSADPQPGGNPFFVGLPPSEAMIDLAIDMLKGTGLRWGVMLFGGDIVRSGLARIIVRKGGDLTVGLEAYGGDRAPSNLELVEEAVAVCREEGRPMATPGEAARLLDLPCAAATLDA